MKAREQLGRGAWVIYEPSWLEPAHADRGFRQLLEEATWVERPIFAFGRPVMQPRLIDWGGSVPYRYSGQTLEQRAMHPWVEGLRARLAEALDTPFNHAVLNLYRDGRDHVSMHADNEPELGKDPLIASISLGGVRAFDAKRKTDKRRRRRWRLAHGSLLVMGGTFQHRWRHSVPVCAEAKARINITFRYLLRSPPGDPRTPATSAG